MQQSPPELLTLRYPIQFAPGKALTLEGNRAKYVVLDREVEVEANGRELAFLVPGLETEEAAREWMVRLEQGCLWAMLQCDAPFRASQHGLDQVALYENWREMRSEPRRILNKDYPDGVDGLGDSGRPQLFPDGARVAWMSAGTVSVTIGISAERYMAAVAYGGAFDPRPPADPRLSTALGLFASAAHESSATAQFLTYVTALEAMVEPRPKSAAVVGMVDDWITELEVRLTSCVDDIASKELDSLRGQLGFLREESIRAGLRRLVADSLSRTGEGATESVLRDTGRVYDARSILVHDGVLASDVLGWARARSRELCAAVLSSWIEHGRPGTEENP